jgi:hypothetical protein
MYIERRFPWPWEVRAAAVAVLLATLAGTGWAAYQFVYVPHIVKAQKREQYEQRLFCEQFGEEVRKRISELPGGIGDEAAWAEAEKNTIAEKECRARFGVHPIVFKELPYSTSHYFDDVRPR